MENKLSFKEVSNYKLSKKYYKPHPNYNIKYLLSSIYHWFGIDEGKGLPEDCLGDKDIYDNVILIVLDGFSFYLYEKCRGLLSKEIVKVLDANFLVSKITTIFPSSTTAVIPYFTTGYLPEESGLYEWWQFEHNTQELICPFTYMYKRDGEKFDMNELGIDSTLIFSKSKFFENLKDNAISVVSCTENYQTPFNIIANQGITVKTGEGMDAHVNNLLGSKLEKRNFFYIYTPTTDYFQHKFGVDSQECYTELINVFNALHKLIQGVNSKFGKTKIVITADHGLVDIDYKNILMLNKEMENINMYLKESTKGHKIVNGGSPMACVLHVKDELIDEFMKEAKQHISGYGEIFRKEELFELGLFNTDVKFSESFDQNMGNIVLLAYEGKGIWFDEDMSGYRALHGGLSEKEMHIPLIVSKTSSNP